jgi:hypothetical protein
MQHGHANWTCSIDMRHGDMNMYSGMDKQQEHGHAARTCSLDMQHENAIWQVLYLIGSISNRFRIRWALCLVGGFCITWVLYQTGSESVSFGNVIVIDTFEPIWNSEISMSLKSSANMLFRQCCCHRWVWFHRSCWHQWGIPQWCRWRQWNTLL